MDLFREYAIIYEILIKIQNEKPLSDERYIAYTKDLSSISERRESIAMEVRSSVMDYMNTISGIFKLLMDNIVNGNNKIIDNPDDIINFEVPLDIEKKLNNKTINDALTQAYYFSNAVAYEISEGYLSGNIEFVMPVKNSDESASTEQISQIAEKIKEDESKHSFSDKETNSKSGNDSIINEIEDIFNE